jgi:cyclopropane fatty-acyl-phospholipid synthase-like methyltransferase
LTSSPDRGDDFYNGFLGPSMIYTSGIWHTENDTLEQAQINKMVYDTLIYTCA